MEAKNQSHNFARKPIAKDEQVLVYYGKKYWNTRVRVEL